MPAIGDTSIQRFKYEGITLDQWKQLKKKLMADFKFQLSADIGKVEYGERTYEWQTGVFEWEFRIDHNSKPEIGILEFGIRRRAFDCGPTNLEVLIKKFFNI